MRHEQGFTMIELMVVVVIMAVLAAMAIPAYGRYAYRARRPDGQEILLRVANAQERYYAVNNRYGDLKTIGFSATTTAASAGGYYAVEVQVRDVNGAGQGFLAIATALGVQSKDTCGDLSIDDTGVKLPAASDTARNANGRCW